MPARAFRLSRRAAPRALRLGGLAVALAALALTPGPAAAQLFFEPFSYRFQYPPPERDAEPPMRPREAIEAARAQGFEPVGGATLNREVYVFDAQDRAGRPVRVIMDAYEGEILRVMGRADGGRRVRPEFSPGPERGDGPRVIEGVGPDDAPSARPRRESAPRPRPPKREATAPTKPIEARPLEPPKPADKPAVAATRPAATATGPVQTTPTAPPVTQPPTEAPGPIPSPPFASGAYSKPPAPKPSAAPPPAMPPVAPLDEVKPQVKSTPPVPPATLE